MVSERVGTRGWQEWAPRPRGAHACSLKKRAGSVAPVARSAGPRKARVWSPPRQERLPLLVLAPVRLSGKPKGREGAAPVTLIPEGFSNCSL